MAILKFIQFKQKFIHVKYQGLFQFLKFLIAIHFKLPYQIHENLFLN